MAHPTYEAALRMTKAQLFEYISTNSDTHVAKSWNREHLLSTYANAFPAAETPKAKVAKKSKSKAANDVISMSFGPTTTSLLAESSVKGSLVEVSQADRGKFTFTPEQASEAIAVLEAELAKDVAKKQHRNFERAIARIKARS